MKFGLGYQGCHIQLPLAQDQEVINWGRNNSLKDLGRTLTFRWDRMGAVSGIRRVK